MAAASLARTLWLIPTLTTWFSLYPSEKSGIIGPSNEVKNLQDVYDYVIIGGGTAGSIVANRLTEDSSVSVLLLEAGGEESHEGQIPAVAPYLQLTDQDWQYKASPSSTSCLAMNNNRCNLPRGKVIGGSSSINFMLYVRGNKEDFDQWEALGNTGWGFEKVLPYFKKSENNRNPEYSKNEKYHSVDGLQRIKEPRWRTPLAQAFLQGGEEIGYQTLDVNAENQTGFMFPQGFHDRGTRHSSARSFLQPIQDRENLIIKLHSFVTKILFDGNKRAKTVLFERANRPFSVNASKEIILCGGAFGSPHILMLSGIGPASHLQSKGITPIVDLPVGQNLQDHVAGQLPFIIDNPMSIKRSRLESLAAIYQYIIRGSGPLTSFGAVEGLGFIHTKYSNRSLNWPDIEFQFVSSTYASDRGLYLRHTLNLREEYWNKYLKPLSKEDAFTILFKLLRPRSRGYIELESSNPKDMPRIVTNYLSEPVDILTLKEGLKMAILLGETKAFEKLGAKMYTQPVPGCEMYHVHTDKYWECYIRHFTLTIYHYSGTAKMGPYWDPESVVDSYLRVYGVSGIRVVDASIFPTIPSGNTNAATMMVAEKASDMIKGYWKRARKVPTLNTKEKQLDKEKSSVLEYLKPHFLTKREIREPEDDYAEEYLKTHFVTKGEIEEPEEGYFRENLREPENEYVRDIQGPEDYYAREVNEVEDHHAVIPNSQKADSLEDIPGAGGMPLKYLLNQRSSPNKQNRTNDKNYFNAENIAENKHLDQSAESGSLNIASNSEQIFPKNNDQNKVFSYLLTPNPDRNVTKTKPGVSHNSSKMRRSVTKNDIQDIESNIRLNYDSKIVRSSSEKSAKGVLVEKIEKTNSSQDNEWSKSLKTVDTITETNKNQTPTNSGDFEENLSFNEEQYQPLNRDSEHEDL